MTSVEIALPSKLKPIFLPPRGSVDYRGAYGGRGSGKSFSFAKMAAIFGYCEPLRILATREFQVSIKESFHAELKAAISSEQWLADHYDVGADYLRGKNGTEFIFRGLRRISIKSLAKIDLTIVEEAEDVPDQSWLDLEATVFRQPKSELWPIWNPNQRGSATDKRFRKHQPEGALITEINWPDNPFFPPGLEKLRKHQQRTLDPATYAHVWDGAYLENSDAQVLHGKWRVAEFEPSKDWHGPYYGLDFGFSQDPTAANKLWINGNTLYIEYEANKIGLELDETARFLIEHIPGIERHEVRADNARPESISYLARNGLPRITACDKGKGSVEDGIQHLRSYDEIIIHPRCKNSAKEARLYSYKVDDKSGQIMDKIIDAHNHHIDDWRYALEPVMKANMYTLDNL